MSVRPSVGRSRVIFEVEKYAYKAHLVPCILPCSHQQRSNRSILNLPAITLPDTGFHQYSSTTIPIPSPPFCSDGVALPASTVTYLHRSFLTISSISLSDGGVYVCSNLLHVVFTVVAPPLCIVDDSLKRSEFVSSHFKYHFRSS